MKVLGDAQFYAACGDADLIRRTAPGGMMNPCLIHTYLRLPVCPCDGVSALKDLICIISEFSGLQEVCTLIM